MTAEHDGRRVRLGNACRAAALGLTLALCGCSIVTVMPYCPPAKGTSLKAREGIYLAHRVAYVPLDGSPKVAKIYEGYSNKWDLAAYYADSGCPQAARLLLAARPKVVPAIGCYALGLVGLYGWYFNPGSVVAGTLYTLCSGLGLGRLAGYKPGLLGGTTMPAADRFNAFLLRDLGLDGDKHVPGPSCDGIAPTATPSLSSSAWYGSLEVQFLSASTYAWAHDFGTTWNHSGTDGDALAAGGGFVLADGLTLEFKVDVSGFPTQAVRFTNAPPSGADFETLNFYSYGFTLTPGYTFTIARYPHDQELQGFVGFQVGPALLDGEGAFADKGSRTGTFGLTSQALEWGPLARVQVPTLFHMDTFMELGYRVEKFNRLDVASTSGDAYFLRTPYPDYAGQPAFFDFSGPYFSIGFQFGEFPWSPACTAPNAVSLH